ncbi:MAG: magnesium chelatase subunit H [Candidatus Baldrarchaeia archaeon]
MVKVVMIGYQFRPALLEAVKKVNKITGGKLDFSFFNAYDIETGAFSSDKVVNELLSADIVLIDVRGGDRTSKLLVETLKNSKDKTIITLVGGSPELIRLTRMGSFSLDRFMSLREKPILRKIFGRGEIDYGKIVKMRERFEKLGSKIPIGIFRHARNFAFVLKCHEHPSEENYVAMLLLLLKEYGKVKIDVEIPEPKVMPPMGIEDFHTGQIYDSTEEYLKQYRHGNRPLVGILFYGGHHYDQSLPAAKLLAEEIERLGLGVIPVFCEDLRYYLAIEKYFLRNGRPVIDALVDLLWFRFAGGPVGGDHRFTFDVLTKLNVPVLHGIHLSSVTAEKWKESRAGVPPIEMVTSVILPELDGRIEPHVTHAPVHFKKEGVVLEEYIAIEDRIRKLARRVLKWVHLKRKPNKDKKIAIIIFNYPPGEENLGKVAYLDVFASISKLLSSMREHGYFIDKIPSADELKELMLRSGAVNSGEWVQTADALRRLPKVDKQKYIKWFNELPENVRKRVLEAWGEPPGKIMVFQDTIIIPGIILGNVFIGVQPSRGVHEDPSKIYHSRDLPPHHQYIAFYKWLEKEFRADAVVHFGTHGTLEFLPGKDAGLSEECFPDLLLGDLPNIYIYHVVNSSEAAIAKHRSYAVIIGHSSPPVMVSGSHDFILELERLLNQYHDTLQYDKEKAATIAKKIIDVGRKYGLGDSIDKIHDRIYEYKRALVPKGLHVLGETPSEDDLLDYLTYVARYDRGTIKSLHRIIAESMGFNYYDLLEKPSLMTPDGRRYSDILDAIEKVVRNIIKMYVFEQRSLNDLIKSFKLGRVDKNEMRTSLEYAKSVKERVLESSEIEGVLRALNGEYILPGPGGDPIRSPEVFPTGRNVFQLDPTNIPTEVAMERGARIAEEYIRRYYEKYGRYPKVVSVVLWGFETMKTGGETVAAIFRLLGVRPIWKSIYIRDLEVIPLEELGRPRIDVLVTICGIFRDTFYNIVELLDRAFKLVASLDEPPELNYVKAHTLEDKKLGEDAIIRIFGPPEGEYATTLTTLIESGSWRSEADLVNAYMESMRFGYGEYIRGKDANDVFNKLISRVDLVAQIRDSIDYEITDLDHYYEFLGGLTKSVEKVRGEKPLVLVADSTRERVKVEHVDEAIRRGVATRLLNPRWLDEMLKHGFNGSTKIADRVEYLLGLAATVGGVQDWMWDKVAERIVFDREVSDRIKRENPWAFQKIVGRLLEAHSRGYWRASSETIEKLRKRYQEIEALLEDKFS